jgi:hypothetical protein
LDVHNMVSSLDKGPWRVIAVHLKNTIMGCGVATILNMKDTAKKHVTHTLMHIHNYIQKS